ncbi:MAG: ABC transporter permease [Sarcina sp.]
MLELKEEYFQLANKEEFLSDREEELSKRTLRGKPLISIGILVLILIFSIFAEFLSTHNPSYMDLKNVNMAPCKTFLFGTDSMGRDIYSMICYGGRISLTIGFISTALSTTIGVIYGTLSGLAKGFLDNIMMRTLEIFLSMPSILIILFFQGILGKPNIFSIAIVIGVSSWMNIAKVVRIEVKKLKNSEYVQAAKAMGGSFFYILKVHLFPNFIAAIMFMVVTNIAMAIAMESTLSFLGIGLPIEIISWGSMLSLAEQALLSNYWWIILIPGIFLVVTLVSIANIGNYLRKKNNKKRKNL